MNRQSELLKQFIRVRQQSERICVPLAVEDYVVQPRREVSPPKWHLAHTTWFFEVFILKLYQPNFKAFNSDYLTLFNSYYKSEGVHWQQGERGQLSRPTVSEIYRYRHLIDDAMCKLLDATGLTCDLLNRVELGIEHEQQHQELLLMDIKAILSQGPSPVPYRCKNQSPTNTELSPRADKHLNLRYCEFQGGLADVGISEGAGVFSFCNERPQHRRFINPYLLSHRTITNGEFLRFMDEGGYANPLLWPSDGWDWLQREQVASPLYWRCIDGEWFEYTLHGLHPLELACPVSHVSLYEATAYAAWVGARLPTEFEYEHAVLMTGDRSQAMNGDHFVERQILQPAPACADEYESNRPAQLRGSLWEWTSSAYAAYPGYCKPRGAFGEYNQKFMMNQYVLRGGSFATPQAHYRDSYRNFFYSHQRWAFTGFRLAKDLLC